MDIDFLNRRIASIVHQERSDKIPTSASTKPIERQDHSRGNCKRAAVAELRLVDCAEAILRRIADLVHVCVDSLVWRWRYHLVQAHVLTVDSYRQFDESEDVPLAHSTVAVKGSLVNVRV
jgi:hypothetical protein